MNKTLKLLFATTSICAFGVGTGFVTLPAAVGAAGFWPSFIGVLAIWYLGIVSGKLYLEAFLAVPEAEHIYSLTRVLSPRWSALTQAAVFFFYCYILMVFYILFMQDVIRLMIEHFALQNVLMPHHILIPLLLILGVITFLGRAATLGTITGLFLLFCIFQGYELINSNLLLKHEQKEHGALIFFFFSLGAIFNVTFYQSILPTIIKFLDTNRKQVLSAVWIGWSLGMFIYLIWLWITLRPEILSRFLAAFESKSSFRSGFTFLQQIPELKNYFRVIISISGIISILSVSVALADFLKDSFRGFLAGHAFLKRVLFSLLIFVPTPFIGLLMHRHIISFTTIISAPAEFFLACAFPLAWVWGIRYRSMLKVKPVLKGGKPMMIGVILASMVLFFILITVPINQIDW